MVIYMDLTKIIIKEVPSILTVYQKRGNQSEMKDRQWYGLSFTHNGQITYTQNGKKFVSDKSNAVILPKGGNYSLFCNKDGTFPVINFECDFLTDTVTLIPMQNVDIVFSEYDKLKNMYIHQNNHLALMSIFYNMLYHITVSSKNSRSFSDIIEFIENNYSDGISNEVLAEKCNMTVEHFRKQFAKTYGISPMQYVINVRINMAKQMLLEEKIKISEISEKCGFSNPYHFCRLFKKKTGITPTSYMEKNKSYKI